LRSVTKNKPLAVGIQKGIGGKGEKGEEEKENRAKGRAFYREATPNGV
jgi:hypothetical protein